MTIPTKNNRYLKRHHMVFFTLYVQESVMVLERKSLISFIKSGLLVRTSIYVRCNIFSNFYWTVRTSLPPSIQVYPTESHPGHTLSIFFKPYEGHNIMNNFPLHGHPTLAQAERSILPVSILLEEPLNQRRMFNSSLIPLFIWSFILLILWALSVAAK